MVEHDDPETATRETYDRIAADYCRTTPAPAVRGVIVRAALEFLAFLTDPSRILVLGAGDGRDATIFLRGGHSTTLLDYSMSMIRLARALVPSARIVQGDVRFLPFAPATFDAVWASACLYHVRRSWLPGIATAIYHLLRPGGVIYLNLRRGSGETLDPRPRSYSHGGPRFYAFYGDDEALAIMNGFEILEQRTSDPVLGEDYLQLWARRPREQS